MNTTNRAQDVLTAATKGWQVLLLVFALLAGFPAWGADGVLVIGDVSRSYVKSFTSSLVATLDRNGISVTTVDTGKFEPSRLNVEQFRCIITVGNEASRHFLTHTSSIPVLHALVTESYSRQFAQAQSGQLQRRFLLVDQPMERIVLLAKAAMPIRSRVGVIYGPHSIKYSSELNHLVLREEMRLIEKQINEPAQLGSAVSAITTSADLLLTLPDPMVVNEGSAKTLILGTYMGNLPLLGYSQALVKAGALMAVYSTPEQLGRQGAELILSAFWNNAQSDSGVIYPRYYQVSVNYQVARALQIELPSESELEARLERLEMAR